jgi:hypothetical protein
MFFYFFSPFTLSLPLPPTFPLPHSLLSSASAWTLVCVCADPRMSAGTWASVRAYITPVRIPFFCSFSPLPLVGVVEFAWQRPFRLAKGEGVTSILTGIPLRFLQSKNSRVVFTLLMLVFSVMQVFM